jgi:hypothetical protein
MLQSVKESRAAQREEALRKLKETKPERQPPTTKKMVGMIDKLRKEKEKKQKEQEKKIKEQEEREKRKKQVCVN